MKVVVFGGRAYANRRRVEEVLDFVHREVGISHLVHGGAGGRSRKTRNWYGADVLAGVWALDRRVPATPYPADWRDLSHPQAVIRSGKYGLYDAAAGPRRNQAMLDRERPAMGIEFPGGDGTADMRARCLAAGIPVLTVDETSPVQLPLAVAA